MEEEIEDEFYCGEPIEEKKRGFTDEYKDLMRSLTDVSKQPDTQVFRQRPILGNRILTPVREGHHISDHDFVRLWQGHTSIIDLLNACDDFEDQYGFTEEHTIREIIDRATYLRRKGVNLKEYVI
tara:strand:+ start:481 stop:855 length:375 start_codon:yes stop_codon:yes gene_type:complete